MKNDKDFLFHFNLMTKNGLPSLEITFVERAIKMYPTMSIAISLGVWAGESHHTSHPYRTDSKRWGGVVSATPSQGTSGAATHASVQLYPRR